MRVRRPSSGSECNLFILVDRPQVKAALHGGLARLAEERPDAGGGLAFAAREHDQRPGGIPFAVFFPPVVHVVKERPEDAGGVTHRRTQEAVGGEGRLLPLHVRGADPASVVEEQRPERKEAVVPADGFDVAEAVGLGGDLFVFVPDQRPELPALQPVAVAETEESARDNCRSPHPFSGSGNKEAT